MMPIIRSTVTHPAITGIDQAHWRVAYGGCEAESLGMAQRRSRIPERCMYGVGLAERPVVRLTREIRICWSVDG